MTNEEQEKEIDKIIMDIHRVTGIPVIDCQRAVDKVLNELRSKPKLKAYRKEALCQTLRS